MALAAEGLNMEMTPVESSNLAAVGYEPESGALHVQFNNGATWVYAGVPPDVFDAMMDSPSKGSFFARTIKNQYPSTRT